MATGKFVNSRRGVRVSPRRRSPRTQRIGIFGGTFNPIHNAHLRSAEEVRERQHLDRVLFVPSATPPHKGSENLASAAHRLTMVRLAIARNPAFRVSTIEIDRRGRSYSVDTLRALHAQLPAAQFVFIVGLDAFREIGTWKDYAALFELCDLVVTSRPGLADPLRVLPLPVAVRSKFCYRKESQSLEHRTGHKVIFQPLTPLDISSTALRERLGSGLSIRYLIPAAVERYIARHRLYGVHPERR